MIQLSDHAQGVVLPVRAQPRARKPGVQGQRGGALKIAVSAPPEDGRANDALLDMLAQVLHVRRSQVMLLSGQTARDKKFLISGLTRAELEQRLTSLLAE